MRIAFEDDDLRRLYEDPQFRPARFSTELITAYRKKVALIAAASSDHELRNFKSLHLEKLHGNLAGTSSIRLNKQWRLQLTFRTEPDGRIATVIAIVDYH